MADTIQNLFPKPSSPPSKLSPFRWPGISHQSTETVLAALKENHEKYHTFFNARGFHNHVSHYILALWGLGADPEIIAAAYKHESSYQIPGFESPEAITVENFKDHLGDDKFYTAFRRFFTAVIQEKGVWGALDEYVFDKKANFDDSGKEQPELLNRFLGGLLHPMIHAGYGAEFGLHGLVVEGLASMSVHKATATVILPVSLWDQPAPTIGGVAYKNVHAFTILARILKDPQFKITEQIPDMEVLGTALSRHGQALNEYVKEWSYNLSDPNEVERKIEELVWANTLIYGIGGWTKGEKFNNDFFHMHLVTSTIFLSSLAANLKPSSQELLLRGYFAVSLIWWIGRGRPDLDIAGFFADDTAYPTPSGPFPAVHEKSIPLPTSVKATTPNPWFPIIQASHVVPDDHLCKIHRALAHLGSLYGARAPGEVDFTDTELPFAEKLDGSLFIRTAGLTNQRLQATNLDIRGAKFWDRKGFYTS